MKIIRVALPLPLYRLFDYRLCDEQADLLTTPKPILPMPMIGARVLVPFGKAKKSQTDNSQTKQLVGIVVDYVDKADVPIDKLKTISQVLDDKPIFDEKMLHLAKWLSDYYCYPFGDTLSIMLPRLLRQGKALNHLKPHWQLTQKAIDFQFTKQAKKQEAQFNILARLIYIHSQHEKQPLTKHIVKLDVKKLSVKKSAWMADSLKDLQKSSASDGSNKKSPIIFKPKIIIQKGILENTLLASGIQKIMLKRLAEKGLIEHFYALPAPIKAHEKSTSLTLNDEQQLAYTQVKQALGKFAGFLLAGVTGSGKTEVYLQLIRATLALGKQVLLLVPEIGLTPQTLSRFQNRFSANIVTLHSHMNETQRLDSWAQIALGTAHIIIGTRSAVLAPFAHLGLIIVDEEHDTSYKQQNTLRYHARDVALYRGFKENCPVLLGSATPSFESLHRVSQNKLTQLDLTKRAGDAKFAPMKIVDIRSKFIDHSLSEKALEAIRYTLDKDEQVLVFLNRRGYAPVLICEACGWQMDCPNCDARMTLHYQPYHYLKCHHCEWQVPKPKACKDCGSTNLKPVGTGTARLEEFLATQFKDFPLIRIDADTTRKKDSWQKLYQQIHSDQPAILLGTQMLAKGHHFPNVTLVVMPNVDKGLLSSDFRAPERVAQLMVQVAGRAGRGNKRGTVLVQSLRPEHPLLTDLVANGYMNFAKQALAERQHLYLPPYSFTALLRVEGKTQEKNTEFLYASLSLLPKDIRKHIKIIGPLPAPMEKKASRMHAQVFFLCTNRAYLHQILSPWWQQSILLKEYRAIKATLDIDPIEFSS